MRMVSALLYNSQQERKWLYCPKFLFFLTRNIVIIDFYHLLQQMEVQFRKKKKPSGIEEWTLSETVDVVFYIWALSLN